MASVDDESKNWKYPDTLRVIRRIAERRKGFEDLEGELIRSSVNSSVARWVGDCASDWSLRAGDRRLQAEAGSHPGAGLSDSESLDISSAEPATSLHSLSAGSGSPAHLHPRSSPSSHLTASERAQALCNSIFERASQAARSSHSHPTPGTTHYNPTRSSIASSDSGVGGTTPAHEPHCSPSCFSSNPNLSPSDLLSDSTVPSPLHHRLKRSGNPARPTEQLSPSASGTRLFAADHAGKRRTTYEAPEHAASQEDLSFRTDGEGSRAESASALNDGSSAPRQQNSASSVGFGSALDSEAVPRSAVYSSALSSVLQIQCVTGSSHVSGSPGDKTGDAELRESPRPTVSPDSRASGDGAGRHGKPASVRCVLEDFLGPSSESVLGNVAKSDTEPGAGPKSGVGGFSKPESAQEAVQSAFEGLRGRGTAQEAVQSMLDGFMRPGFLNAHGTSPDRSFSIEAAVSTSTAAVLWTGSVEHQGPVPCTILPTADDEGRLPSHADQYLRGRRGQDECSEASAALSNDGDGRFTAHQNPSSPSHTHPNTDQHLRGPAWQHERSETSLDMSHVEDQGQTSSRSEAHVDQFSQPHNPSISVNLPNAGEAEPPAFSGELGASRLSRGRGDERNEFERAILPPAATSADCTLQNPTPASIPPAQADEDSATEAADDVMVHTPPSAPGSDLESSRLSGEPSYLLNLVSRIRADAPPADPGPEEWEATVPAPGRGHPATVSSPPVDAMDEHSRETTRQAAGAKCLAGPGTEPRGPRAGSRDSGGAAGGRFASIERSLAREAASTRRVQAELLQLEEDRDRMETQMREKASRANLWGQAVASPSGRSHRIKDPRHTAVHHTAAHPQSPDAHRIIEQGSFPYTHNTASPAGSSQRVVDLHTVAHEDRYSIRTSNSRSPNTRQSIASTEQIESYQSVTYRTANPAHFFSDVQNAETANTRLHLVAHHKTQSAAAHSPNAGHTSFSAHESTSPTAAPRIKDPRNPGPRTHHHTSPPSRSTTPQSPASHFTAHPRSHRPHTSLAPSPETRRDQRGNASGPNADVFITRGSKAAHSPSSNAARLLAALPSWTQADDEDSASSLWREPVADAEAARVQQGDEHRLDRVLASMASCVDTLARRAGVPHFYESDPSGSDATGSPLPKPSQAPLRTPSVNPQQQPPRRILVLPRQAQPFSLSSSPRDRTPSVASAWPPEHQPHANMGGIHPPVEPQHQYSSTPQNLHQAAAAASTPNHAPAVMQQLEGCRVDRVVVTTRYDGPDAVRHTHDAPTKQVGGRSSELPAGNVGVEAADDGFRNWGHGGDYSFEEGAEETHAPVAGDTREGHEQGGRRWDPFDDERPSPSHAGEFNEPDDRRSGVPGLLTRTATAPLNNRDTFSDANPSHGTHTHARTPAAHGAGEDNHRLGFPAHRVESAGAPSATMRQHRAAEEGQGSRRGSSVKAGAAAARSATLARERHSTSAEARKGSVAVDRAGEAEGKARPTRGVHNRPSSDGAPARRSRRGSKVSVQEPAAFGRSTVASRRRSRRAGSRGSSNNGGHSRSPSPALSHRSISSTRSEAKMWLTGPPSCAAVSTASSLAKQRRTKVFEITNAWPVSSSPPQEDKPPFRPSSVSPKRQRLSRPRASQKSVGHRRGPAAPTVSSIAKAKNFDAARERPR
eukprot:gene3032-4764_t